MFKIINLKYLFFILMFSNQAFGQNVYFEKAYKEINLMLEDKQVVKYRKAVFLTENAFSNGKLDENLFNKQLDSIIAICKKMIAEKGLQNQKTAAQWAIFGYMCKSIPYNNFKPYSYDYESLPQNASATKQMVSNLLKTGKGNCHSFPLLFLILSQELNAESYLAIAPMHFFIKHKDEKDEWWNLELTSGSFSRTSFIIESFGITDKQIESGFYLKPLNQKETLASILKDLFHYYDESTGIYYDDFVSKLTETGLKYYPVSTFLAIKIDILKYRLDNDMAKLGLNDYTKISLYPNIVLQKSNIDLLHKELKSYGYQKVSHDWYENKVMEALKIKETTSK